MDVTFEHRYAAPVDRVIAMYHDEEFARKRGLVAGAIECDALVDGEVGEAFTIAIRRTVPTDGMQPEFRPFIGPSIKVRYAEAWAAAEGDERTGTFAVEIVGAPARASGTVLLEPDVDGSFITFDGSVVTNMPFLAGPVTQAVAEALARGIEEEFAVGDAWLARA